MLPLFMLALSYDGASFLFSVVVFYNEELVHNEEYEKENLYA